MAHSFNVKFSEGIATTLKKVESYITGSGGTFSGTEECGTFHGKTPAGMIKGQYSSVSENEIMITITDKPFIVPHSMIETEIRRYFG
jgi:hypothetical protein